MFVQLPSSKAIINLRTVKRVTKYGDQWQITLDLGSVMQADLQNSYVDNIDYDYLWTKLVDLNGAS